MNLSVSNKKNLKLNLPAISMNTSKNSFSNIYRPKIKYSGAKTNYNISTYKSKNFSPKINYSFIKK